jgi:hypothetical protein
MNWLQKQVMKKCRLFVYRHILPLQAVIRSEAFSLQIRLVVYLNYSDVYAHESVKQRYTSTVFIPCMQSLIMDTGILLYRNSTILTAKKP